MPGSACNSWQVSMGAGWPSQAEVQRIAIHLLCRVCLDWKAHLLDCSLSKSVYISSSVHQCYFMGLHLPHALGTLGLPLGESGTAFQNGIRNVKGPWGCGCVCDLRQIIFWTIMDILWGGWGRGKHSCWGGCAFENVYFGAMLKSALQTSGDGVGGPILFCLRAGRAGSGHWRDFIFRCRGEGIQVLFRFMATLLFLFPRTVSGCVIGVCLLVGGGGGCF